MDDNKVSVPLIAPAKINGVREPAGKTVTVSTTLAIQLAASGAIPCDLAERLSDAIDMSDTALESDFQQAVKDAAAGRIDVLKAENLVEVAHLENKIFDLSRDLDQKKQTISAAASDLQEKENLLIEARQKVADLETELTGEKQVRTDAESKLAAAQAELAKLAEKAATTPKPAAAKK
ncbi:hypothetical protein EGT36_01915 [Agrobacterium sp. FDAARGOS_525]|uniref:hypothetical protein n=1 Tax=Agrobacterium sp. FDAARGOS_525 TaxID=2420311 RepID=UPI000F67FE1E|nr:hypothetical protein [Agrobacterium sp. FDAARGOS_525]RSC36179.1 hypothetical protein EGT36_01915 [Agrobacterium sp. FDAARGOS_525]